MGKGKKQIAQYSDEQHVLSYLLDDPTRSIRDIAKDMDTYRQKVWREKKKMEDDHIIWGYTAIYDEKKVGHVLYIVLFKTKPMSRGFADLILRRVISGDPARENVRLINMSFVNGEFDWILKFSSPDPASARRYYDKLRVLYDEYILEKPLMLEVNFSVVRSGKINPETNKLYDFIPI